MRKAAPNRPLGELVQRASDAAGVALSIHQVTALERFVEVLLLWRRRMTLVSQRTGVEIVAKHVEDSLAVAPIPPRTSRVVDLGTGAGFPGMVLALARDDLEVFLVESQRRKASFLREAARITGAKNVTVVEGRAELMPARDGWSSSFDVVVTRAVWPTPEFLQLARPFLCPGGLAVAMKTPGDAPDDLSGYDIIEERPYRLTGGEARALVVARRA